MDPAIAAARALLPAWVPWGNVAMHPPVAFATTLLAAALATALATRPRDLGAALGALDLLAVSAPLVWAASAATSAGPIGLAPWWALSVASALSSLLSAALLRALVRRTSRRATPLVARRTDRAAVRAVAAGVLLCAGVALSLRAFAGQAWSREREARVFAVAFTGGHDRTLADLAWVTAQRGDQRGAAVFLEAALRAEASAVPAANLTIVLVNEGRCGEAAVALRESRRRVAAGATSRERALLRLAMEALRGCEARGLPAPITGGS